MDMFGFLKKKLSNIKEKIAKTLISKESIAEQKATKPKEPSAVSSKPLKKKPLKEKPQKPEPQIKESETKTSQPIQTPQTQEKPFFSQPSLKQKTQTPQEPASQEKPKEAKIKQSEIKIQESKAQPMQKKQEKEIDILKKTKEQKAQTETKALKNIQKEQSLKTQTTQTPEKKSLINKVFSFAEKITQKQESSLKQPEETKELSKKISFTTKAKSIFSKKIKLSEQEIDSLLFDIELSLIQADVDLDTAQQLTKYMKEELLSCEFDKKNIEKEIDLVIKKALSKLIDISYPNLIEEIKEKEKPVVVLFFGPNGAGKTTTIAKLSKLLKDNGLSSILAASDTFRAASIEQIKKHADTLNTKVISQTYGSDPAAVAYDAIKSAKANNIDVVLIDTAGRQETNKNLLKELEKIVRVTKPDFKIYVGESISGTASLNQAKEFDKTFGLDGFILTKLDLDPKGGSALSLIYNLKKPIFFFGTGQEYSDLKHFNKDELLKAML